MMNYLPSAFRLLLGDSYAKEIEDWRLIFPRACGRKMDFRGDGKTWH